jgi:hypothetical protein
MFRTTLGPTKPPIQWVPGALSLEVKRPGREVDHSPSSAEVKECVEIYLHSPNTPSRRGAQSTGTILPLPFQNNGNSLNIVSEICNVDLHANKYKAINYIPTIQGTP